MKFGKEFASQMVQEWQDAYMDYNSLKMVLKEISNAQVKRAPPSSTGRPLKRRISLYRAFSGLTSKYRNSPKNEDEVILTSVVTQTEGPESYQTTFLMSSDEGGDNEFMFFRRLDEEFNKVLKFYKKKVEEMVVEAEELSKQMDVLIALRVKVENPVVGFLASDNGVSSPLSSAQPIHGRKKPGQPKMDMIQEIEMSNGGHVEEEEEEEEGGGGQGQARKRTGISGFKPAPLEILNHIKIKVSPDTPVSTLKGIVRISSSDLSYSKQELKKSEDLMSQAFMEFYRQLQLLKSFCFLNQLAFSKIMKKYDKITSRSASKAYLKMVDSSFLSSSDEVSWLMDRVEATFVKHFANGNRRKGMSILRPKVKKERHRIIFTSGVLFGCSIALVVAIIVTIQARNLLQSNGGTQYMENIFPLYSIFGYIILHLLMYAGNIYFWRRYKVNYTFMFGFKQGTELGCWEIFFLSSALAVLTTAGVLSNLDMDMDPRTQSFKAITELVPLFMLTIVTLIMIFPYNVVFRSSRFFFLISIFHCFCAPLYKITLADFFLGDQLTSQVQSLRSLAFYVCYYGWGNFKTRTNNCSQSEVYKAFYFIVAMIPYWLRSVQCLRRAVEEKSYMQLLNMVKYFSTIVAVAMRTSFELNRGVTWQIWAGAASGVATILGTYWDIVIDWGLLQPHSKNPWLRDKLLIPNKSVYFIAMVMNVILRLAWMQSVLGFTNIPFLHRTAVIAVVACLEIIRRGIWNFFRLENEHLNNVGKYRAFKSVPLPFDHEHETTNNVAKIQ